MTYSRFVVVVARRHDLSQAGIVPCQTTFYHNEGDIREYLTNQVTWVLSHVTVNDALRNLEKCSSVTFFDYKGEWSFLIAGMAI